MKKYFSRLIKKFTNPMIISENYISIPLRVWSSLIVVIAYFIVFYSLISFIGPGIISSYLVLMIIISISITRLITPFLFIVGYYLNLMLLNLTGYNSSEYIGALLIALFIFTIISYIIPTIIYKWEQVNISNKKLSEVNKVYLQALKESSKMDDILSVCTRCNNIETESKEWITITEYLRNNGNDKINVTICPSCINKIKDQTKRK